VVARSNEAKAMGIAMGTPFFRVKHLVTSGNLLVCSGDLPYYRRISMRVMKAVRREVGDTEQYSIDECFFQTGVETGLEAMGCALASHVLQATGIPVSVGIARTKTLAKLASRFPKRDASLCGCYVIDTEAKRLSALAATELGDVWGVGRRVGPALRAAGLRTAADLLKWTADGVRKWGNLPLVYTWQELQEHVCHPLHERRSERQSISQSRTFQRPVTEIAEMRGILHTFLSACASHLRKEHAAAHTVTVWIRTDRFRPDLPQYAGKASARIIVASADPRELGIALEQALSEAFRPYFLYKKAGVTLSELEHGAVQGDLFDNIDRAQQARLLAAMDRIQEQLGPDSVKFGSQTFPADLTSRRFAGGVNTSEEEVDEDLDAWADDE